MEASVNKVNMKKLAKILPFVAFLLTIGVYYIFSALKQPDRQPAVETKSAFNTKLPSPSLDEKYKNKLDIYMEAQLDSQHLQKERERDEYAQVVPGAAIVNGQASRGPSLEGNPVRSVIRTDANEKKVAAALDKLYRELNRRSDTIITPTASAATIPSSTENASAEINQLEKLMTAMDVPAPEDPETKRLEGMLDKILQIQHPERLRRSDKAKDSTVTNIVSVSPSNNSTPSEYNGNGFYGLADEQAPDSTTSRSSSILAVVHEDQTVKDGATVKLRLLQDIYVKGTKIPANSFIYGQCSLGNERLEVDIKHAVYENTVFPVNLSVYDTDGIPGIYVPGAVSRDVAKEGLSQAIQGMELYSMDPSIGAQAASAGIQAAKSLISKKSKTINVTLKAGHAVLLSNTQLF